MTSHAAFLAFADDLRGGRVERIAAAVASMGLETSTFVIAGVAGQPSRPDLPGISTVVAGPGSSYRIDGAPGVALRFTSAVAAAETWDAWALRPPDVLHSFGMALGTAGVLVDRLRSNGRRVVWIHDLGEQSVADEAVEDVAAEWERRYLTGGCDFVTVRSWVAASEARSRHGLRPEPTIIVNGPGAASAPRLGQPTLRATLGLGDAVRLAACWADDSAAPGLARVVEMASRMHQLHLVVACHEVTPALADLRAYGRKLGLTHRLHLSPGIEPGDLVAAATDASFAVVPHRSGAIDRMAPETLAFLHAGVPLVVEEPAEPTLVNAGLATSYALDDREALIGAAHEAARSRDKLAARRHAAGRLLVRTTWDHQVKKLRWLYTRASAQPPLPLRSLSSRRPETLRVLHAPLTTSSAQSIVRAQRRLGLEAASFGIENTAADVVSDDTARAREHLLWFAGDEYDVLHVHAQPLLGGRSPLEFPGGLDLLALRAAGIRVVVTIDADDVALLPDAAVRSEFLRDVDPPAPDPLGMAWIRFAGALADCVVVPDPDVQRFVPGSVWVPRPVDLQSNPPIGPLSDRFPLVVHATRDPADPVAEHVLASVELLRQRGLEFRFQLVDAELSDEVEAVIRGADVVIDRLDTGWYGEVGVLGMALGKPVMAHIDERLRSDPRWPPAVAPVTLATLPNVLADLVSSPEARETLGKHARVACEQLHAADVVASRLAEIYRQPATRIDATAVLRWVAVQRDHAERQLSAADAARDEALARADYTLALHRRHRSYRKDANEMIARIAAGSVRAAAGATDATRMQAELAARTKEAEALRARVSELTRLRSIEQEASSARARLLKERDREITSAREEASALRADAAEQSRLRELERTIAEEKIRTLQRTADRGVMFAIWRKLPRWMRRGMKATTRPFRRRRS